MQLALAVDDALTVNLNSQGVDVATDEADCDRMGLLDAAGLPLVAAFRAVLDLVGRVAVSMAHWAHDLTQHRAESATFVVLQRVALVDQRMLAVSLAELAALKEELMEDKKQLSKRSHLLWQSSLGNDDETGGSDERFAFQCQPRLASKCLRRFVSHLLALLFFQHRLIFSVVFQVSLQCSRLYHGFVVEWL